MIHRFIPGSDPAAPALLLLHGTGGDENDLLELGRTLSPGSALLSPRGQELENGHVTRWFRRLAEGIFDEKNLVLRTHELADFVASAAKQHGFDPQHVVAVGFSNGANVAAATLLLRPEALAGAVLLRAMVPLVPQALPDLTGKRLLLAAGRHDPLIPRENIERLATMFRDAHAAVDVRWADAGHPLTTVDVATARDWLGGVAGSLARGISG